MTLNCPSCNLACRLTDGAEIYPHRPDLRHKPIWKCDGCGAYVGCHPNTTTAMGIPANAALRSARVILHNEMLDPLWENAWREPCYANTQSHPSGGRRANGKEARDSRKTILKAARGRVYAFLAFKLGIADQDCHTGHFDIETCRLAWTALRGVTYAEIREWAKSRKAAA